MERKAYRRKIPGYCLLIVAMSYWNISWPAVVFFGALSALFLLNKAELWALATAALSLVLPPLKLPLLCLAAVFAISSLPKKSDGGFVGSKAELLTIAGLLALAYLSLPKA